MEDIIILVFQIAAQIVFELLAYWPFDIWWPARSLDPQGEGPFTIIWVRCLTVIVGGLIGWGSLYFFPDVMVKFGWLRIALLIISPLGSAFLAKTMAESMARKDSLEKPMAHFWFALCFSAGLVFVRFTFAHRPA